MNAKDIMTREVTSVTPGMKLRDLICLLAEKKLHGAPVIDKRGCLVGIITENDVIFEDRDVQVSHASYFLHSMIKMIVPVDKEQERFLTGGAPTKEQLDTAMEATVKEKMTSDVVTVAPETSMEEISGIMHSKSIHLLPVEEDGELVGIVGKADILKGLALGRRSKKGK